MHHHGHDHSHHHDHAGMIEDTTDGRQRVAIAGLLTFGFMIAEIIGGLISGSLALLADAAHMLTDTAALGLAWLGFRFAARQADETHSYGWGRLKVIAAFVNGLTLLVLAGWILIEAAQRLYAPQPIMGELLLAVAVLGLLVNIIAFRVLHGGDHEDLNMQAALWHVAGDMFGSVAAIIAALVILYSGWTLIDPILSVIVAMIIILGGVRIVRSAARILMQGVPSGLSLDAVTRDLITEFEEIQHIGDTRAWALNEKSRIMTLRVEVTSKINTESLRAAIKARLQRQFHVDEATVEIHQSKEKPAE
ncbi:MAG: cation diffusion facilitator family transporter [Pseudomonadota bacterium]